MALDLSAYKPVPDASGDANQIANALQAIQDYVNASIDASRLTGYPSDASQFLDGSGGWTAPTGIEPGTLLPYGGAVVPSGYLAADHAAVSRSTYAGLLNALAPLVVGNTVSGNTTLTITSGIASGDLAKLVGAVVEGTGVTAGTTIASVSGLDITLSAAATGNGTGTSFRLFPHGAGDGSTTFNTPDGLGRGFWGVSPGGAAGVNGLGKSDGRAANVRNVSHYHTYSNLQGGTTAEGTGSQGNQAYITNHTSGDGQNQDAPAYFVGQWIVKT